MDNQQTETKPPTELDRLIALARMSDNARIQACANELQAVYAKWQCHPVVLSQVTNGVVTVQPGLQALPVSITPQG
jgi:hypothetical protein